MRVKVYDNNLLYLSFSTQKELVLSLCRPQEFYECNSKKLRGNQFSLDELIDHYLDDDGNLTYFSYWAGFNIPGHVLEDFFKTFSLNKREQKIFEATRKFISEPYYVIATKKGDEETLDHELIHGYYYLNLSYKQEVDIIVRHMRPELRKQATQALKSMGYTDSVMIDEINAYMATSSTKYLQQTLGLDLTIKDIRPFRKLAKTILRD